MAATTPIPTSLATAYEAARAICRAHARSFCFASHFLPRPKRDHAYAIYAFCRQLDDAADESRSDAQIDRFESVIRGTGCQPVTSHGLVAHAPESSFAAFNHTVRVCAIPQQYFLDLAAGCRMDLAPIRFDTWPDLECYCYHVAGVVGLMMCHVFGLRDASAMRHAVTMGTAMQLTNILRDVREDLDRGRIYLPREDLDRFGVSVAELETRRLTSAMAELVAFEIARARSLYNEAARGLWALPADGSRQTACVMAVVYAGILNAIEADRHDVFAGRAKLSPLQKLARLPRAMRLSKCERGDEVPAVFHP